MPKVLRKRRIANPGRAAPPGTPKKGSQEARDKMARLRAMRNGGKNSVRKSKKRAAKYDAMMGITRDEPWGVVSQLVDRTKRKSAYTKEKKSWKRAKRQSNVGELVTISLGNPGNPGERKSEGMRRRRRVARRRNAAPRRTYRRRRNPGVSVMANPRRRRYARRNPSRRVYRRRRNPDVKGTFTQVGGVLGGAALTGIITGMLPISLTAGLMGLAVTAGVAFAQGMLVGNFAKNQRLGESMTVGGLTVVALKLIAQFIPGAGGLIPIGLKGLGHTYVDAKTLPPPMVGKAWLNYPMSETYGGMMALPAAKNGGGVGRASW